MIRKVKTSSDFRCEKCCYKETKECASVDCGGCYYADKPSAPNRTRPRKSRDRRLLEALLNDTELVVGMNGIAYLSHCSRYFTGLSYPQERQLIAIKEAMRKGGGK